MSALSVIIDLINKAKPYSKYWIEQSLDKDIAYIGHIRKLAQAVKDDIAGMVNGVQSVTGPKVDNTDPSNPIINVAAQGSADGTLPSGTDGYILYYDSFDSKWKKTDIVFVDDINDRVGIGTATPSAELHVKSLAGTAFLVEGNATNDILKVLNSGTVGIGETNPTAKLHVKSATGTSLQVDTSTITNNLTVLDSGGLVGIGKTPVDYKLDVVTDSVYGMRVLTRTTEPIMVLNYPTVTFCRGQGPEEFIVNNLAGSTNIKSASTTFCQNSFFIASGTQFGGEIQHKALLTNHLVLTTASSSKDIIVAVGVVEKLRVKNTEILSQVSVGIGNNIAATNASAILQADSTTQGFLPPRMTSTQASAITKVDGLMLYVTDTNGTFTSIGFWGVENNVWVKL